MTSGTVYFLWTDNGTGNGIGLTRGKGKEFARNTQWSCGRIIPWAPAVLDWDVLGLGLDFAR